MSITNQIAAYWKLDEASGSASDATGNGNTLANNGTTTYATGLINNGADFGTTNSTKWLSANGLILNDGPCSMSFWVKQRTEIASGSQTFFSLSAQSHFIYLTYEFNGGTRRLTVTRSRNNLSNVTVSYNITLGTANWYHLVVVYNETTLKLYVNNVEVATVSASGNGTTNWAPGGGFFSIGAYRDPNDGGAVAQYSSSYIDEFGVWARALTSNDIANIYVNGVGQQYPFTGLYTLEAEAGTFSITGASANLYVTNMTNLAKPSSSFTNLSKP